MKFYLSSIGVKTTDELYNLIGKSSEIKTALITNAFDYKSPDDRKIKYELVSSELTRVGFDLYDVNLKNYHNEPERLQSDLIGFDMIWICGGNVFLLRELCKQSGLDQILVNVLESGVVYGGDSAGAIIVGPSLTGFDQVDHTDYVEEIIYEGLGLVDFVVTPHNGNPKFQSALDEIKVDLKSRGQIFEVINDNQAVVVNGGVRKVVG